MKKLFFLILTNTLCILAFAQQPCKTMEELKDLPTTSKLTSVRPVKEATKDQMMWMKKIYSTIIEPAVLSTKGMAGNWSTTDYYDQSNIKNNITKEKLVKSEVAVGFHILTCKNNQIKQIYDPSISASFGINYFVSKYIAYECHHEEVKVKGKNTETVFIDDTFNGQQIYYLQANTTFGEFAPNIYYQKAENEKYFILCKPDVPLFIPLTVRQVVEINKKNLLQAIEDTKAKLVFTKPETRAEYEKKMADDFAAYRRNFPDAEKVITDLIKQLEDQKLPMKQQVQTFIDLYTNAIKNIDTYLKTKPTEELEKVCYGNSGLTGDGFLMSDGSVKFVASDNAEDGNYFIFNPAYFNRTISKATPQFITVSIQLNDEASTSQKALKNFLTNLDFEKLNSYLVK